MGWHLLQTQIRLKKYGCLKRKSVRPYPFHKADYERPYIIAAKLKIRLQEQNNIVSLTHHRQAYHRASSASSLSASSGQIPISGNKSSFHSIKNVSESALRQDSLSPELHGVTDRNSADTVLQLIYSGWNPDLPEPHILNH
ncbi:hypothetical protein J3R82DRAFT_869 [Butyriboletus roseoflavus]|nr:hypothetical protein J3R82DRAFT_869 [Butyriboletus roseoflavus]